MYVFNYISMNYYICFWVFLLFNINICMRNRSSIKIGVGAFFFGVNEGGFEKCNIDCVCNI